MIGLIGRQQFHGPAQRGHGAGDIANLEAHQREFVVRRAILLIAFESVPVLDGGLFVTAFIEVLIAALQITFLDDIGVAAARRKSHENCQNDRDESNGTHVLLDNCSLYFTPDTRRMPERYAEKAKRRILYQYYREYPI